MSENRFEINIDFDNDFEKMQFYQLHRHLMPFVGKKYISSRHGKILVVGESHYVLNTDLAQNYGFSSKDKEKWYEISSNGWSESLKEACDPRISMKKKLGRFSKNICAAIRTICDEQNLGIEDPINEFAYYNYFLRPVYGKGSIKKDFCNMDTQNAFEVLKHVIEILKPDCICIASKFVGSCIKKENDGAGWEDIKAVGEKFSEKLKLFECCHPSSKWWYKRHKMELGIIATGRESFKANIKPYFSSL